MKKSFKVLSMLFAIVIAFVLLVPQAVVAEAASPQHTHVKAVDHSYTDNIIYGCNEHINCTVFEYWQYTHYVCMDCYTDMGWESTLLSRNHVLSHK